MTIEIFGLHGTNSPLSNTSNISTLYPRTRLSPMLPQVILKKKIVQSRQKEMTSRMSGRTVSFLWTEKTTGNTCIGKCVSQRISYQTAVLVRSRSALLVGGLEQTQNNQQMGKET